MSKSLKYLNHIKNNDFNIMVATYPPIPAYNGISKSEMFNIIEKELTALDIINKKKVDVSYLEKCDSVDEYNLYISNYDDNYWKRQPLDKDEFDLLKEVLGNDGI